MAKRELRPEIREAMRNILDCFAGADGGGRFVMYQALVRAMDDKASEGDQKAEEILDVVRKFSRLINVANMKPPTPPKPEVTQGEL